MASEFEADFSSHLAPGPDQFLPGAVLAFTDTSGSKSYLKALGHASPDGSTPLATDALFWSASCTKLITTIACLECVELGLFSPDSADDVTRLLPELVDPDLLSGFTEDSPTGTPIITKAKTKITLRHLLTHTSGLAYAGTQPLLTRLREYRQTPAAPLTGSITKDWSPAVTPLIFEPGTDWAYGTGVDWAGLMVERANLDGLRLEGFMAKHIFAPLEITDSVFDLTPALRARLMPMSVYGGQGEPLKIESLDTVWPPEVPDHCGGVGLYTTAPDYLKVMASLLRNDGKLLRPETVDSMFQGQVPDRGPLQKVASGPLGRANMVSTMPEGVEYTFGWGGIIALDSVEGRLGKGALLWGGMPNLQWYIDRETGYCGFLGTQYRGIGEGTPSRCVALKQMFQSFAYAECTRG